MSTILFETRRLICRHIERPDDEAMFAVYGDAETMRFVGDSKPLTLEDCQNWIEVTFKKYQLWGYGMSALVRKGTGQTVGFCGLVHPQDQPEAEVKYALRKDFWGEGLASEAIAALLAYGIREFMIDHIIATVSPLNHASQRVLDKAGMVRGELRPNADGSFTQMYSWGTPHGPIAA